MYGNSIYLYCVDRILMYYTMELLPCCVLGKTRKGVPTNPSSSPRPYAPINTVRAKDLLTNNGRVTMSMKNVSFFFIKQNMQ